MNCLLLWKYVSHILGNSLLQQRKSSGADKPKGNKALLKSLKGNVFWLLSFQPDKLF